MKRKLCFIFFFLSLHFLSIAQGGRLQGKVVDENGTPLAGVTVTIQGSNIATQTDKDGNFSLDLPASAKGVKAKLELSYTGYKPSVITAEVGSSANIQMEKSANQLEDVVVVGYSSVKRRDLTGSVSSVNAKQIKDIPLSSAAEALTGKLAGVQVTTTEGAPGSEVIIRIRGGGSITQDNSPIYIVDGIQVENALNVLSPQDIASVDVLKDASTTAIYGARGANGVVIITTKSGKPGKTIVTYNGSYGWREISRKMGVLDPYDFVLWQYERAQLTGDTSFNRIYGSTFDTLSVYKNIQNIDWQEEVFGRKAPYFYNNVAVSGGSQGTTFNLSLTSNKEDGILLESGFDRKLVNFKLDHKANNNKLKVGMVARYIDQTVKGAGTTNSGTRTTNRLRNTIQYRPFEIPTVVPPTEFDEDYYQKSANIVNPVLLTQAEYKRAYTKGTNLTGYFSYAILKNLTFKTTLGWDYTNIRQDAFFSKITGTARNFGNLPVATIGQQNNTSLNNNNTLQYTLSNYKDHHDFDILLGEETLEINSRSSNIETRYFPADITPEKALANMGLGAPPAGSTLQQARPSTSEAPPYKLFSLFGQVNYGFDKKILATFTLRSDRSSKFKYDNGALLFPSGRIAWRFTQEKFMEKFGWLSDGKIRFGYGTAGNDRIGNLLYQQLYGVTGEYALNHSILPGFAPSALANEDLKWEKTVSQNLGLDLSFLQNRVQFTVDLYKNKGNDLLLAVAIPPTSGYTSQLQNVGSTSNRGIEFQVSATAIQKREFSWISNFNISFNKNNVESLGGLSQQTRNSGWQGSDGQDDYLVKVGQPVGLMYGYITDGWYKIEDFTYNPTTGVYTLNAGVPNATSISGPIRPGSLKIKDINGDKQITSDSDRVVIGNANPKFSGGWNNQFTWKNFDFSIFVNFVYGNDVYNANKIEWTDGSFPNLNTLAVMKDRFTNIDAKGNRVTDPTTLAALNQNAKIWTPNNSNRFLLTTYAIEDGSFLRINNLTLGYNVPATLLKKIKISQFRVYATVNNLHTFTNYSGYDPEVYARRTDPLTPGVDFAAYPKSTTWVFGLNVGF